MNEDRRCFWGRAFHNLSLIWSFLEPTADRITAYDNALQDLSLDQLHVGVSWVLGNLGGKHTPTPGDIRDGAQGPLVNTARFSHGGALLGWEKVRRRPGGSEPSPRDALGPLQVGPLAELAAARTDSYKARSTPTSNRRSRRPPSQDETL